MQQELPLTQTPQSGERRKMDDLMITQLNRIENKVDKYGEAIERLARTEERVTALLEAFKELTIKDSKLEERISTMEKEISTAKTTGKTLKRVIQIAVAGIIFLLGNRYGEIVADMRNFIADTMKGPAL